MADLSNTSFIPKQNPTKVNRRSATRQVYVLTLVSYVLIFAALIASVAIFFYERHSQKVLADEIKGLSEAAAKFNQEDMDAVAELDERLQTTKRLVKSNISMPAVLAVLELQTIASMQFLDTTITRPDEDTIKLEANVRTDSFDSVLFQREVYAKAATLEGVELTDVAMTLAGEEKDEAGVVTAASVALSATFVVPASTVLYTPGTTTPTFVTPSTATSTLIPITSSTSAPGVPGKVVTPATMPTVPTAPATPGMPTGLRNNDSQ